MWSKCDDENFHVTFVVCASADKSVAPLLLVLPGKRFNRDILEGCNIESANITTAPKCFIDSNLFLRCL